MDLLVAILTGGIGLLVILAALYMQNEGKPGRTAGVPKPRGSNITPKGTVVQKSRSKKKKTSKKKKNNSAKKNSAKKETKAAAPAAAESAPVAELESKTSKKKNKKQKKVEDLAQAVTSKDGISGLSGSTFADEGADDGSWTVKKSKVQNKKPSASRQADSQDATTIPCHNIGLLIGRGGSTIGDLQARHNVKIDTPDNGSNSNKITVKGDKANVDACVAEIGTMMGSSESSSQPLAQEHAARIIGKGGSTIQRLQTESGCDISVKRERGTIEYRGSAEEIAAAKALVKEIVAEAGTYVAPEAEEKFDVKSTHVGLIVGRKGATINKLREGGAKIELPKGKNFCVVSGTKVAVKEAVAAIKKIIKTADSQITVSIPLPEGMIALAIGKGGKTINKVRDDTGANVSIKEEEQAIEFRGDKNQCAAAKAAYAIIFTPRVDSAFRPLPDGVEFELITVPTRLVGSIIGARGKNINTIKAETKASLDFNKKGGVDAADNCRLSGTKEAIAAAKVMVLDQVVKLEAKDAAKAAAAAEQDDEDAATPEPQAAQEWVDYDGADGADEQAWE